MSEKISSDPGNASTSGAAIGAPTPSTPQYVLVSLKHTHPRHRYVTFWRPNRAGYCWPLSWAGVYSANDARYLSDDTPGEETFAVPVEVAFRLSRDPAPGYIDGNAGPVVTKRRIAALRAAALGNTPLGAQMGRAPSGAPDAELGPGRTPNLPQGQSTNGLNP